MMGVGLALTGCLKPVPPARDTARSSTPGGATEAAPTEEERAFATGPIEAEARDPQRRRMWTVRATSARLDLDEARKGSGDLFGVTGELFQQEKPVSRFSADRGTADQARQVLSLRGQVQIRSLQQSATLSATSLEWQAGRQRLEAKGDVRVVTPDYEIGPFPVLFATPDLRTVATPDRFPGTP